MMSSVTVSGRSHSRTPRASAARSLFPMALKRQKGQIGSGSSCTSRGSVRLTVTLLILPTRPVSAPPPVPPQEARQKGQNYRSEDRARNRDERNVCHPRGILSHRRHRCQAGGGIGTADNTPKRQAQCELRFLVRVEVGLELRCVHGAVGL